MCRIAGIIDRESVSLRSDISAMTDSMRRGGPDSEGVYIEESIGLALGHRRLSIIDLSHNADQPMFDAGRDIVLVYNGEIYNYLELKSELIKHGFVFTTNSDTEVVINSYRHWGASCVERFKGMFAIALYDKAKNTLLLVRDQVGIKPLYYYCKNGQLYFASEIKAFHATSKEWEENYSWKVFFLTYGYLPEPVTTLKDVKPVRSGSYLLIQTDTLEFSEVIYYKNDFTEKIFDLEEAKEVISNTLTNAVERHLIADAPIGLFLSGGIDSSLMTLLAKQFKKDNLHTLSIVFDDKAFSEKYYQDIIVKAAGSDHKAFTLTKDIFLAGLEDYFNAMDQPSADGINTYFISKYARVSGLKAVISGLGADELLGGYASFRMNGLVNASKILPGFLYKTAECFSTYKYKKIAFLERKDAVGDYLFNRGYYSPVQTARILDMDITEVRKLLSGIYTSEETSVLKNGNKVSGYESELYMRSQLLRDTDLMSMWHGIEVRVPFLDIDFVRAVNSISSTLKFGNKQGKYLLIESFKDILPQEVWNRKKQGFVFPFRKWITSADNEIFQCTDDSIRDDFSNGKLDWSRYWTYLISNTHKPGKLAIS